MSSEAGVVDGLFFDDFELGVLDCWDSKEESGVVTVFGQDCQTLLTVPTYSSEGVLHSLDRFDGRSGVDEVQYFLYFAGRPVAQVTVPSLGAPKYEWITPDHLGTPAVIIDAAGVEVWGGGFEPFGRDFSMAASTSLRMPGQWVGSSWSVFGAELVQNLHRWYLMNAGRYSRDDPVGRDLHREGIRTSPPYDRERFSFYSYVGANPLNFIDPLGLLRFKGCTPQQEQAIADSFEEYCNKIRQPEFTDCLCENRRIADGLSKLCSRNDRVIRCKTETSGRCDSPEGRVTCAWSLPWGKTIRLCPGASAPPCTPLGCTLMHEMTHQLGIPGEAKPDAVEDCLGCD